MILRQGYVRDEHFAHKAYATCDYAGESMEHLCIKKEIYNWLDEKIGTRVKSLELEKHLGTVRPDVFVEGRKSRIAIEVQASCLTAEQIISRTERYYELGIYVLWVLPWQKSRYQEYNHRWKHDMPCEFRIKEFERVISYMCYRTLFFWRNDGFIVGLVDDSFTEGADFYDRDGSYQSFAPRKKKTIKWLTYPQMQLSLEDLVPSNVGEFPMPWGDYNLPARKVMTFDWRKIPGATRKK